MKYAFTFLFFLFCLGITSPVDGVTVPPAGTIKALPLEQPENLVFPLTFYISVWEQTAGWAIHRGTGPERDDVPLYFPLLYGVIVVEENFTISFIDMQKNKELKFTEEGLEEVISSILQEKTWEGLNKSLSELDFGPFVVAGKPGDPPDLEFIPRFDGGRTGTFKEILSEKRRRGYSGKLLNPKPGMIQLIPLFSKTELIQFWQ